MKELLHILIKFISLLFFVAGLSIIAIEYSRKMFGIDITLIVILVGGAIIGSCIAKKIKATSKELEK